VVHLETVFHDLVHVRFDNSAVGEIARVNGSFLNCLVHFLMLADVMKWRQSYFHISSIGDRIGSEHC
jgi:hypothetical protein